MNHNTFAKQFDLLLSPVLEENESESLLPQNTQTRNSKTYDGTKAKDIGKLKYGLTSGNRSVYLCKYSGTSAKRKPAPVCVHSNPSTEAVLRERRVEIKDLESQVVFYQNRVKELKVENKTLMDIQSRQEKELRKFKEGVADIPALLRSHKEEIKASESAVTSLRRELLECQKDLKARSDVTLRKDQQLDKLNLIIKRLEKRLQDIRVENKQLKVDNKKLEEENKKLIGSNEELKSKTDSFKRKIQGLTSEVLNAEKRLGTLAHFKSQLESDLHTLQNKYDESVVKEIELRKFLQTTTQTIGIQTDSKETVSKTCMTTNTLFGYMRIEDNKSSPLQNLEKDGVLDNPSLNQNAAANSQDATTVLKINQNDAENTFKSKVLEPLKPIPSIPMKTDKEQNCGDDLSAVIASNSSFQTVDNEIISHPDAVEVDFYGENRMCKTSVTEAEHEVQFSFSSNNVHSERQKPKRLFSNFTLTQ